MPTNPVDAGRKGGQSRSDAKLAAARRNGFQRAVETLKPSDETTTDIVSAKPLLFVHAKRDVDS
ncbi:MAG TPA: hypothetical protein VKR59_07860 [Terriglobales bacterium]|nr:hypothetical protein [Terriglobales bacterium]